MSKYVAADGTEWDRPEDAANHDYYTNMPTRPYRVVIDVDVEWRDDDPDYARRVIEADYGLLSSVRILNPSLVSVEALEAPTEQVVKP